MCQLTYANLKNKTYNKSIAYLLGFLGSKEKHDDGCGLILSDNKIWKTKLACHNITNLGELLNEMIIDNSPVPFHIRQATYGIEVNDENAHPFRGKHFILMHNGTLHTPDEKPNQASKKNDSDSLKFLKELDAAKEKNPKMDFVTLFNETMKNFSGKFAFIIREIKTGNDYIIRGRTADLWITFLTVDDKPSGYFINTSRETSSAATHLFVNLQSLTSVHTYKFDYPKLLSQETIFLAGKNNIEKLGDTKENDVPKKEEVQVTARGNFPIVPAQNNTTPRITRNNTTVPDLKVSTILNYSERIAEFLENHSLFITDLQIIFQTAFGISLLETTCDDLRLFVEQIIPKISAPSKKDNIRKQVKDILNKNNCEFFPLEVYDKSGIAYPWTVEEPKKVLDALNNYFI